MIASQGVIPAGWRQDGHPAIIIIVIIIIIIIMRRETFLEK